MRNDQIHYISFDEGETLISNLPFKSVRLITMTETEVEFLLQGGKRLVISAADSWQRERLINAISDKPNANEARP